MRGELRGKLGFFLLYSAQFFALALTLAAKRPLWTDEFFTLSVARVGSLSRIWQYLQIADSLPPLYYALAALTVDKIEPVSLALRLPAVFGYWAMALGLYLLLSRRVGWVFAAVGLLAIQLTTGFEYAYEGRPYSLVMASCAWAFFCWDSVEGSRRPAIPAAGMALALSLGVSSHFYAVLVFVPIGCGELAYIWQYRKVRVGVWVALLAGLLPLLAFGPMIRHARGYSANFWAAPTPRGLMMVYSLLLDSALPVYVALAALVAVARSVLPSRSADPVQPVPAPFAVAMAALVGLPVATYGLAVLVTNAFTPRYTLPALVGFGMLIAVLARDLAWDRRAIGPALVVLLLAAVLRPGPAVFRDARGGVVWEYNPGVPPAPLLAAEYQDLPIVVTDMHQYLNASYYWDDTLARRLVYLFGVDSDSLEIQMRDLGRWPVRTPVTPGITDAREFLAGHPRFLILGSPGATLLKMLDTSHLSVKTLAPGNRRRAVSLAESE